MQSHQQICSLKSFTIIVRNFFQKPSHGFKLSKLCHLWNTSSSDLALEKNDIFKISYSNCCQTSTSCASLHYCLLLFIESNSRWFSRLFGWITKSTFRSRPIVRTGEIESIHVFYRSLYRRMLCFYKAFYAFLIFIIYSLYLLIYFFFKFY